MLETASTVMRRRIGRCAIRNGRDRAARDPRGQDQRGITLQSLIVISVLVVLAVAVSFTLFAINAGSSEDLEAAGQTDAGGTSCAPNEIFDLDYQSKGLGGPQGQRGVVSSEIGCRPHCATWEFMTAGPNDDGEYELTKDWLRITQDNVGGPEGSNDVFSSRIGCFAPCYWEFTGTTNAGGTNRWIFPVTVRTSSDSVLHYYDDNRVPVEKEVRLGVVYARGTRSGPYGTDHGPSSLSLSRDGKRPIVLYHSTNYGAATHEGSNLVRSDHLGLGTVATPNWRSYGTDAGPGQRYGSRYEDEDWVIRANPESKTCEIINPYRNDELVCTSARDNCAA